MIALAETADGFLLDLTDTLTSEVELQADLLKSHLLTTADPEEELHDLCFTLRELRQDMIDLLGEGFVHECAVSIGSILVDEHVQ